MMKVQATPKTHPGGVQGARFSSLYQSEVAPPSNRARPLKSGKIENEKQDESNYHIANNEVRRQT